MKKDALVMTIDFGRKHSNTIYLDNHLKLISSNGYMITLDYPEPLKPHEQTEKILTKLIDFFRH